MDVWSGFVTLSNLTAKLDVINAMLENLLPQPFAVEHMTVGNLEITVPWSSLGSKPVIVVIDKVNVLVSSDFTKRSPSSSSSSSRRSRLAALRSPSSSSPPPDPNFFSIRRWLGEEILNKVVETFQLHIRDVHVRLEDPQARFGAGVTLESLHVHDNKGESR
ncbi:hypothetical protein TrRE_jg12072 [Triparma retinervis]|uniref:Chorein N-terminal domain-containing protein n=1 Tax=Triparma retinervis TaxID=2557542 RepID=A0A9W7EBC2_9STRA|nr:hypothetical protein TrRE_jg12072 [Triparma retinervis]